MPRGDERPARFVIEVRQEDAGRPDAVRKLEIPYEVEPLFPGADPQDEAFKLASYYIVTLPVRRGDAGPAAHDVAYKLRALPQVERSYYEGAYRRYVPLTSVFDCPSPPADRGWARRAVRAPADPAGGAGVVIAHPDTGWVEHSELDASALDLDRQWNTITRTADARDPRTFPLFKAHGTSTATVLASRSRGDVTGIAPGATIIPIRCVDSVVLVFDVEVAQAIWYACQQDTHVISLSVGGHPAPYLEGVLGHAVYRKHMIVCAAAGNAVPYVVYPAAYPDCIAVAATTPTDRPSNFSSFGSQVTISAPGHRVWKGDFDKAGAEIVDHGCGTSYAAPHVAGAAALWLAHHGRESLLARYGAEASLQHVFALLLRRTARNPGVFSEEGEEGDVDRRAGYEWETSKYGAGILDIAALLAEPLPPAEDAAPSNPDAWVHKAWIEIMYDLFQGLDPDQVRERIERLFAGVSAEVEDTLEQFGNELAQLIMDARGKFDRFGDEVGAAAEQVGRDLANGAGALGGAVAAAAEAAQQLVEAANQTAQAAAAAVAAAAEDAPETAAAVAQAAAAAAQEAATSATTAAEQASSAVQQAAEKVQDAVEEAVETVTETVEDVAEDVADAVSDAFADAVGLFG